MGIERIGVAKLQNHLSGYLRLVEKGAKVEVTDRSPLRSSPPRVLAVRAPKCAARESRVLAAPCSSPCRGICWRRSSSSTTWCSTWLHGYEWDTRARSNHPRTPPSAALRQECRLHT